MAIYCTYLTVYNGNLMPKFYIGSTSLDKIKSGYRGTVKSKRYKSIWKTELQEHPELFITHVLTRHDTRTDALERESRFHEKLRVHRNPMYINMATANGKFHIDEEILRQNARQQWSRQKANGYKHPPKTEEEREKRKKSLRAYYARRRAEGKPAREFSEQYRKKLSEAQLKRYNKLRSEGKPVKTFSEEHRRKISEGKKLWYEKRRQEAAFNHQH